MVWLRRLHTAAEWGAVLLAGLGALIVLIQMTWITYGVVMRYVFHSPDRWATEATALLLFPVAFVGLAYALKENALPKVEIITELLPRNAQRVIHIVNMAVMVAIGGFLAAVSVRATYSSFLSGAASEILVWPKFIFWIPAALALITFTVYAGARLLLQVRDAYRGSAGDGMV